MSDELFEIEERLSPRLAWMKKYGVKTHCSGLPEHFDGEPWNAWPGDLSEAIEDDLVCHGETELDAITSLAKKARWKLWNEEQI